MEKSRNLLFSRNELLARSQNDFQDLSARKVLTYRRPPESALERILHLRCSYGCPLTVVELSDGLEGICLDHPDQEPVPITKDDLNRYQFHLEGFLDQIREANRMHGEAHGIDGDHHYVGYKVYGDHRVGFVFIPRPTTDGLIDLSGLRRLCREDEYLILLSPCMRIEDVTLKSRLFQDNMIQISLTDSLDPRTFDLRAEALLSKLLKPEGEEEPRFSELTQIQHEDYRKFKYQCHDKLYIPGEIPTKGMNLIRLNDKSVKLGDGPFLVLLRLVVGAIEEPGGWVSRVTLWDEKIVRKLEFYQPYNRLRNRLSRALSEECTAEMFIENDEAKHYRISTHPDFITYERAKLLNHPDDRVRNFAARLP